MGSIPVLLLLGSGFAPPSAEEVEKAALDARSQIRSIYVKLSVKTEWFPAPSEADQVSRREIWLSGNKIRGEIIRDKGPDVGVRFIDCTNSEADGWMISASNRLNSASYTHPIGTKGRPELEHTSDPRVLGYSPSQFTLLRSVRLDSVLGNPGRTAPTVENTMLGGTECMLLKWRTNLKEDVQVWVAPSKGHSVVRIDVVGPGGELERTRSTIRSELQPIADSKFWYPKKVWLERHNGNALETKELVEVSEVRINHAIPAETFTFAGVKLADSTFIIKPKEEESGFLRDGVIVPKQRSRPSDQKQIPPPVPVEESGKNRYGLIALSVLCSLAAIAVAFRGRFRAATQPA